MAPNPIVELEKLGQSIWYDNIRRLFIKTGDLKKKIDEDDLRGVTSNPAIFEKAIAGSTDYKEALQELADEKTRIMAARMELLRESGDASSPQASQL